MSNRAGMIPTLKQFFSAVFELHRNALPTQSGGEVIKNTYPVGKGKEFPRKAGILYLPVHYK